jgi:hypothetical protein
MIDRSATNRLKGALGVRPPPPGGADRPTRPHRPWRGLVEGPLSRFPVVTVVTGLTVGVVLGWLIKRR